MLNIESRKKLVYLVLHLILGIILYKMPLLSTYLGLAIMVFATYMILSQSDENGIIPLFFSGYIVGIEILLRMCNSSLFWEFGKYAVIYFILLGFSRRRSNINIHLPIFIYFLLLVPSVINLPIDSLNIWRQDISFNLAGPACLTFITIYLFNTRIKSDELINILFYSLLPILSMSVLIMLKMPNIESYRFTPYSDPIMSGGYGPNQVSTIFGFMISGIFFGQVTKKYLTGFRYIDLLCLVFFTGLGLITFSRGGLFAAIIAISLAFSYYCYSNQNRLQFIIKTIIILIITIVTWSTMVIITEGAISRRYGFSEGISGEDFILDLSGRAEIYKIDLKIFYDHFITGAGPGQATKLREQYGYGRIAAAHTEYSRMLAEHGVLGLFSLSILLGLPIYYYSSSAPRNSKIIKILFGTIALLTMLHSALRIAMPCFAYGFIIYNYED